MFNASQALQTIRLLNFPRFCGSEEEARAMRLLAEELTALGLHPHYQHFEEWWVEPADACLLVKGGTIPVEPAVPLPLLLAFEWMGGAGVEAEICGKLERPGAFDASAGEAFLAVAEKFDPSAVAPPRRGRAIPSLREHPLVHPLRLGDRGLHPLGLCASARGLYCARRPR